jgi:type VI secretion system protein ImpL
VLLELRKNTIFSGGAQAGLNRMGRYGLNRVRGGRMLDDMGRDRARGIDAGDEITAAFAPLHEYVGDGKSPAPVDEFVAALKEAGQAVIAAQSVGGGGGSDTTQAAMAMAMASVKAAASGAPPQIQSFIASAASGGSAAQTSAATGAVSDAYAQSILPACKEVAEGRYPFVADAKADASVVDVLRVFGMGGLVDGFVQQRLKPLMQTDGPDWHWRADDPVAAALNPSSPAAFVKAGQIRDLLAAGLPIKVSVASFGSGVGAVEVANGGTAHRFTPADNSAKALLWSANGGLPLASLVLYGTPPAKPATSGGTPTAPEVARIEAEGPWALFRLIDQGHIQNAGPTAIKASFGGAAAGATLLIVLPSDKNPFSRGGPWSFRCPSTL